MGNDLDGMGSGGWGEKAANQIRPGEDSLPWQNVRRELGRPRRVHGGSLFHLMGNLPPFTLLWSSHGALLILHECGPPNGALLKFPTRFRHQTARNVRVLSWMDLYHRH